MTTDTARASDTALPDDEIKERPDPGKAFDRVYAAWLRARAEAESFDEDDIPPSQPLFKQTSEAERDLFIAPIVDIGDLWRKIEAFEVGLTDEVRNSLLNGSNLLLGFGAIKQDIFRLHEDRDCP